jgi:hypothetical protein
MSDFLPALNSSKYSNFSYLINNNFYDFRVYLVSFDGRIKALSPSSIRALQINDAADKPFHSGYIVLDNRQDNIESSYFEKNNDQTSPNYYIPKAQNNTSSYGNFIFNGDCRDIISIQILPKVSENIANVYSEDTLRHFLLKFDFTIYNTEEINDGSSPEKLKKLYFWDYFYEILREKSSYFSTSNYLKTTDDISTLSNNERRIPTGVALSSLLVETFDPNDGFNITFDNFDTGSTTIFFSAPANYKALDSLNYILSKHVSSPESNFDPCMFKLTRYPRSFMLRSYKDIFNNAVRYTNGTLTPGYEYLETYKVAGYQELNNTTVPTLNIEYAPSIAPYFKTAGNIDTYSFDFVAGQYSQSEITSKVIHFYDYTRKEFEIDSYRNNIDEFLRSAKENYVYPFAPQGTETFQMGKYRTENINVRNIFAPVEQNPNQRLSLGLSHNLKNYIMLNNFITFRVQGSTHRQSGKFIGIVRDSSKQPSDFDSKFLGVYFILEVKHVFENASYYNELICVKTYILQDLFLNKNVL